MDDSFDNYSIFGLRAYRQGWNSRIWNNVKFIWWPCWNGCIYLEDDKVLSIVVSPAYRRCTIPYWKYESYVSSRWNPLLTDFEPNLALLDDILPRELAKFERNLPYEKFIHVKPRIVE